MSESVEKPKSFADKIDLVSLMNLGRKKSRHDKHYGGFNRRVMAATVDSFFLALFEPFFDWLAPINREAIENIQANTTEHTHASHIIGQLITNREFMTSWILNLSLQMLVFCIFSGICWHFWSATPGKILLRMKIVDVATEQKISDRQILIRLLGYWVSCFAFGIGLFWISADKKRRAWHDLMAGTAVITIPWKKNKEAASTEREAP